MVLILGSNVYEGICTLKLAKFDRGYSEMFYGPAAVDILCSFKRCLAFSQPTSFGGK